MRDSKGYLEVFESYKIIVGLSENIFLSSVYMSLYTFVLIPLWRIFILKYSTES